VKVQVTFTAEMGEPTVWRAGYGDKAEAAFCDRVRRSVQAIDSVSLTVTDIDVEASS
jgi:hypothetical protein